MVKLKKFLKIKKTIRSAAEWSGEGQTNNMSMQFISEKLLKREIKQIEENGTQQENELFYLLCKKELAVIEKLKINKIDMRAGIEEVNRRIDSQAIYFMDPKEFETMEEKARKYDIVAMVVNNRSIIPDLSQNCSMGHG